MKRAFVLCVIATIAGCMIDDSAGSAVYEDGVDEMRIGIDAAEDGLAALREDIASTAGREGLCEGIAAMHRGLDEAEHGMEMMGDEWHDTRGCHGGLDDLGDPLREPLQVLDDACDGLGDADVSDDPAHVDAAEEGLHEFEHQLESMELQMECMRHHR